MILDKEYIRVKSKKLKTKMKKEMIQEKNPMKVVKTTRKTSYTLFNYHLSKQKTYRHNLIIDISLSKMKLKAYIGNLIVKDIT